MSDIEHCINRVNQAKRYLRDAIILNADTKQYEYELERANGDLIKAAKRAEQTKLGNHGNQTY